MDPMGDRNGEHHPEGALGPSWTGGTGAREIYSVLEAASPESGSSVIG